VLHIYIYIYIYIYDISHLRVNNAVSNSDSLASDGTMLMDREVETIWNEAVMACRGDWFKNENPKHFLKSHIK